MKLYLKIGIIIFTSVVNGVAFAGVFYCVNSEGVPEFRGTPCKAYSPQNGFLPYTYHKTNQKIVIKREKNTPKVHAKSVANEKNRLRQNLRLKKQIEKENNKKERFRARCLNVQEKIKNLENQLRLGCKIRRCQRLNQELKQNELRKNRYCDG